MLSATFVTVGTVELYVPHVLPDLVAYVTVASLGVKPVIPPLQVNALPLYVLLLPATVADIVPLFTVSV